MKRFLATFSSTEVRNIIAVAYVAGTLLFLFLLAVHAVPAPNKDLVNIVGGYVFGGLGMIIGYYFGASKKDITETTTK